MKEAYSLGKLAYSQQKTQAPAMDVNLINLIKDIEQHSKRVQIMKSWSEGYFDAMFENKEQQ